jgi:arabinofuranan 3-O-arabinosyltransferase
VLLDPALIERYARFGRGHVWVTASSTYTADPQDQPWSAFDGDPATSWIASATDAHPTLHIRWWHARMLRRITIQRPPGAAGLLQVLLVGSCGQVRGGMAGPSGVLRFAPLRTDKLLITFTPLAAPLQVSGVRIPGLRPLNTPSVPLRLRCGLGPLIEFNGKVAATRVSGTFSDLLTGQPIRFTGCARLRVAAGANRVTEPNGDGFDVQDAVLTGAAARPLAAAGSAHGQAVPGALAAAARVVSWTDTRRVIQVSAVSRSYLVLNQNFNPGWQASIAGRRLPAARVDGWKQAWLLPAGTSGTVMLTYPPQAPYRAALTGGLATLALVLLAAWWPGARRQRAPRQQDDAPRDGPRPARPERGRPPRSRRLARVTTTIGMVVAGGGVLVTGFWLGGFPGIVILAAATGLFLFAVSYRHAYPWCRELSQPWVLTALLVAAAAGGPLGESLLQDVRTGGTVTGAWNAIPQITCLIVVGRLAAALILPDP